MVKSKQLRILWDDKAKAELKKELINIRKESIQGAESVKMKIFDTIETLPSNPKGFEEDNLKRNNDGSYRRFFAYSYRVAYRITEDAILIIRIRHTSREPLEY